MKRVLGVIAALVIMAGIFPSFNVAAQNVNNFRISSFDIQYELSKDDANRSVLKTVETIRAEFPNYDQNHGLERALPSSYDGHSVGLKVTLVSDEAGKPREYTTYSQNAMTVLRIGNPDSYVQGSQVYKIAYTQHDVTKFFADNGRDEWYWDTNGTVWQVPIDVLTVRSTIDENLLTSRVGEPACYQGSFGSTETCSVYATGLGEHSVAVTNLSPGQNVTLAIGFKQGTFTAYEPSFFERVFNIWIAVFIITSIVAFLLLIGLSISYSRRRNRVSELHTIVTEYIPPKNTSVLVSSQVITPTGSVFSAQLIDFAVRHFIEIIETKPKSTWVAAEYDIKIITDVTKLSEEEREIVKDMFGHVPSVGERMALKSLRNNVSYSVRTQDNDGKLKKLIEGSYAIRESSPKVSRFFYKWAIALLIIGVLTLSPPLLILSGIIALMGKFIRPLTDKGFELRRYLEGLKKYIKAAETERLKFLQGPDTAEKIGEKVDVNNPGQLVKLYERVLPYAILFGLEKEWTKRLAEFYETTQTSPNWYSGNTAFNAALFSSSISSFSSAASYTGGSSSSSSSGSTGGGSSGGGGGGGGGGGW